MAIKKFGTRVLVLNCDFGPDPSINCARMLQSILHKKNNLRVEAVCAFNGRFPKKTILKKYDRVIITGSEAAVYDGNRWISQLSGMIRELDRQRIPTLGICFGAQMIASSLGGRVVNSGKFDKGFRQIGLNSYGRKSRIFEGFPKRFGVYEYHEDRITRLPPGALALSRNGGFVEAYSIRGFYAVQFHPEIGPQDAVKIAASEKSDPKLVLNGTEMRYTLPIKLLLNFIAE